MVVTARFTGKSESLGYIPGRTYQLRIAQKRGMSIERLDGTGWCPYQSLSAFLRNWTNIQKVIP